MGKDTENANLTIADENRDTVTSAIDSAATTADSDEAAEVVEEIGTGLGATEDFTEPEQLYEKLIETIRKYRPTTDLTIIERAYKLALDAHGNQKRKSGEPYIIHPLSVAIILAELEMDKETIVAGLLHDVVEDTTITEAELTRLFGSEVTLLVDGVTKLTQLNYSQDKIEVQAENLRKMFIAMAKDIRVIVIKLADRLHNQRTMQYQSPEKQIEKSRETMEIYSPLAHRLGISKIKKELDDLALKYLKPDVYKQLSEDIKATRAERESFVQKISDEVGKKMEEAGIHAEIDGRAKHFFSIYRKMVNQNKSIEQIYDLFAVRIIVESVKDCYAALGILHDMYKPVPGRFKDYIAMPKANNYQSLHTTLIGPGGTPVEIQIRTKEMHRIAEYGIAAHWKYKESQSGKHVDNAEDEKLAWLRQILEWQRDMSDNKEFLNSLKSDFDLFNDSVYCFTPTGEVKTLPVGSNTVDFAYSIHSAVGNKMIGARVNDRLVNIEYEIQNGDRVEIITSANAKGPSRDWLKIVKSAQARNKINQWFKAELKDDNIARGKNAIANYAKTKGINLSDISKPEYQEACLVKYGFRDWESLMAAIGHGTIKEGQVVNKLYEEWNRAREKNMTAEEQVEALLTEERAKPQRNRQGGGIVVQGANDLSVHFSKCCAPVPGDPIIGFVTRGRGVSIHRSDCVNMQHLSDDDKQRLIEAKWEVPADEAETLSERTYNAEVRIFANNSHKTETLLEVIRILNENNLNINSTTVRPGKNDISTIVVSFEVHSTAQLNAMMNRIRQVEFVVDVERTAG
ncbi:MAG: bifunctional (p)ppGpp synthetase/guanosine-3',5'-bis(diphosphate) 3'-pyrophosphohydrolase [Lachnospiraceae bacterium]|nr:bifunctional (p)ppGpp synthetase/guanosine-3',5'-bis(diphosphate) 3'-pyrophosphohydrolase [Lachnospiraceae bacterium]